MLRYRRAFVVCALAAALSAAVEIPAVAVSADGHVSGTPVSDGRPTVVPADDWITVSPADDWATLSPAGAQTGSSTAACKLLRATTDVNIRSTPSTGAAVIGTVRKGATVCLSGKAVGGKYTACKKTSNVWATLSSRQKRLYYVATTCFVAAGKQKG
ncbi:SH3 domain-containing protein [Streptomyces sp. TS71-3]|uniref:SH3 domain-containing protein n=1 Tax=Streptomyces sp. TS71-3 TaxID=2733862 RepID=UPI001BB3B09A|nr:SH3 domain-containing protein [Streptomyces sp. TS71-3]